MGLLLTVKPPALRVRCDFDLLIIDELGYLTLNEEQVNMFFKLIDLRYRKKPTIITTNLPFEKWYGVFKNKALVDAMLDRYQHYCTTIHIKGESLRVPNGKKATTTIATQSKETIEPQKTEKK